MFCAILKATNSSFQKGMTFCRSIHSKKVMKLLAFIFEQPSYVISCCGSLWQLSVNPTYFVEFITCNIFKFTHNFALKFSVSIRNIIFF